MSELKTCGDILARARRIAEGNMDETVQAEIIMLAKQMGLIACPGCRAKFRLTLLKSGVSEAVLDAAISEGLEDPNREEAIREKMVGEMQRYINNTTSKGTIIVVPQEGFEEELSGKEVPEVVSKKKK